MPFRKTIVPISFFLFFFIFHYLLSKGNSSGINQMRQEYKRSVRFAHFNIYIHSFHFKYSCDFQCVLFHNNYELQYGIASIVYLFILDFLLFLQRRYNKSCVFKNCNGGMSLKSVHYFYSCHTFLFLFSFFCKF